MTAPALTRASLPAPDQEWETRALCRANLAGLDLTEITAQAAREANRHGGTYTYETRAGEVVRDYEADLQIARQLCRACPVVAQCRSNALAVTDVAGVAGGMTEAERASWRRRNGVKVSPLTARDLLPPDVSVRDNGRVLARVNDPTLHAVRALAARDMGSDDIAVALGVPVTTVRHCRQLITGSKSRSTR